MLKRNYIIADTRRSDLIEMHYTMVRGVSSELLTYNNFLKEKSFPSEKGLALEKPCE